MPRRATGGSGARHAPQRRPGPVQLLDLEASLLAAVVAACPVEALLALEAVGRELGGALRGSAAHRSTWLAALAQEVGLQCSAGAPALPVLKAAWRRARRSAALEGGWLGVSAGQLAALAESLGALDAAYPDGRPIFAQGTRELAGSMRRVALVHFDASGCFASDAWGDILERWCSNGRTPLACSQVVSSCVTIDVEGIGVKLGLMLSGFPMPHRALDPREGVGLGLWQPGMLRYCEQLRERSGSRDNFDILHASYVVHCGGTHLERKGRYLTRVSKHSQELVSTEYKDLWLLSTDPHFDFRAEVSVRETPCDGEERAFCLDEGVHSAVWNSAESGVSSVRLVCIPPPNEFAAHEIRDHLLVKGAVLLVRRGGGVGFAQKALTAQAAGAVGCIIYEGEGDREVFGHATSMGLEFEGREYPAPSIPCVLVGRAEGEKLIAAATESCGATVDLAFRPLSDERRTAPRSFEEFAARAGAGVPVHVAVLLERFECAIPRYHVPLHWIMPLEMTVF